MTTIGDSIRTSSAVLSAIDSIVADIGAKTAAIQDIRGPREDLTTRYEELIQRAGDSRGWPLLYPCLGSGAGNGALVELADGSVKWDLVAGIGVHFFGHSHPEILRAQLTGALEDTTKHGNLQSGTIPYDFSSKLTALAGRRSDLKYAFLTTSGAMANELALKVCMQKRSPGSRILAFEHCFMGRSLTMTSIGDSARARDGIPVTVPVDYMPFWDPYLAERAGGKTKFIDHSVERLEEYATRYPGQHACFVMELIQGEGGLNVADRDWLVALMQTCKRHGIPVWDDEIQSFGRTTEMFAFEAFDVGEYVDVFCVGKMTLACAAMWTEEMRPRPGLLSGTFTGGTVDFAAGLRILEMLEAGSFYGAEGEFAQHHAAFRQHATALITKHPAWFPAVERSPQLVGGTGGMMRLTPFGGVREKIAAAAKAIYREGAIVFWCGHGPLHLRLLPPMPALKLEDWPRIFEVLERGLAAAAE
ncbi:MAG: aminotransferase class III-fold pyridoxal phosphate-dependent enzyme [Myxococcota bacterium]